MRLGYTLPIFQPDPGLALDIARRAEASGGIDAVFVFDHLFRMAPDGTKRRALDGFSVLAAATAATDRIGLGTLVARATLRPPGLLANMFSTLQRMSDGRIIAGLGSGDAESELEMAELGLPPNDMAGRVDALRRTIDACSSGEYPVWIGGTAPPVRELAAAFGDGWNRWGGTPERFASEVTEMRARRDARPFTVSWGGLVCIAESDADAQAKATRLGVGPEVIVGAPATVAAALRTWGDAGADWVVVGAVDASDPENVHLLGEAVASELR